MPVDLSIPDDLVLSVKMAIDARADLYSEASGASDDEHGFEVSARLREAWNDNAAGLRSLSRKLVP